MADRKGSPLRKLLWVMLAVIMSLICSLVAVGSYTGITQTAFVVGLGTVEINIGAKNPTSITRLGYSEIDPIRCDALDVRQREVGEFQFGWVSCPRWITDTMIVGLPGPAPGSVPTSVP